MKKIFERGCFKDYKIYSLEENRGIILEHYDFKGDNPSVFISHKHDDLEDLKGIIGFLQDTYKIKAYIDSQDPTMPKQTSGKTASNIKKRISTCDKFILLATDGAIESKWCNWELGYGDAKKYDNNSICLFPMKEKGKSDTLYKGSEYMSIYPYIMYYEGFEKDYNGNFIRRGYYVKDERNNSITPLETWLFR